MFKKIWTYLLGDDLESKHQIYGVRILVGLLVFALFVPVFWHQFTLHQEQSSNSQKELDSLKMVYLQKVDSLEKVDPTIIYRDKYQKQSSYAKPYKKSSNYKKEYKTYKKDSSYAFKYQSQKAYTKPAIQKFNLNKATTEDLVQINGIGNVYADRIIKYRDRIGGFHSKEQLYEVYNLDTLVVHKVFEALDKTALEIKSKIKINQMTFKELLKHPYMEYSDVQKIFNSKPIFSAEMFCRILPNHCDKMVVYLDFDE